MHFLPDEDADDNDRWRTIQRQLPPEKANQADQGLYTSNISALAHCSSREGQVFKIVAPSRIIVSRVEVLEAIGLSGAPCPRFPYLNHKVPLLDRIIDIGCLINCYTPPLSIYAHLFPLHASVASSFR